MSEQSSIPFFLTQSVHYASKHKVIRMQDDYRVNLLAYEILRKEANREFVMKKYDRACRKYEEALGCFRYYQDTGKARRENESPETYLTNVEIEGSSKN